MPAEELAPPSGAFAWYKATADDVVVTNATLADGNDFLKAAWAKAGLTAVALQPDADGGNTATALYGKTSAATRTLKHAMIAIDTARKTIRIRAKAGAYRYLTVGGTGAASQIDQSATFDLINGVASSTPIIGSKITLLRNQWYLCEVTLTSGPEVWLKVTSDEGQPASQEPLMWVQGAEVEQANLKSWKDRISGRDFKGPGAGWRWVPAASELGGLPALEGHYLHPYKLTAGEAADWSFLHDGSGGTLVLLQHQSLFSKRMRNSLQTVIDDAHEGVHLGASATNEKLWSYAVTNVSAATLFSIEGGSTTGPKWIAASYGADHSPHAQLFEQGVLVASANATSEPTATSGNLPLTLGGKNGPTQVVHEILVYDRVLENAEISQLKGYFAAQLPEK